jgi:hypothetical protein
MLNNIERIHYNFILIDRKLKSIINRSFNSWYKNGFAFVNLNYAAVIGNCCTVNNDLNDIAIYNINNREKVDSSIKSVDIYEKRNNNSYLILENVVIRYRYL